MRTQRGLRSKISRERKKAFHSGGYDKSAHKRMDKAREEHKKRYGSYY